MKHIKQVRARSPKYIKYCGRIYVRAPKGEIFCPREDILDVSGILNPCETLNNVTDLGQLQFDKGEYDKMVGMITIVNPEVLWNDTTKDLVKSICRDIVILDELGVRTASPFEPELRIVPVFAEKITSIFNDASDGDIYGVVVTVDATTTALANMKSYHATRSTYNCVWVDAVQNISILAQKLIKLRGESP